MSSVFTDPHALVVEAYADPSKLSARTAIYAYQRPPHDLVAHVVQRLRAVSGPVLDIGCGPGRFAQALRADRPERLVVGCDLSPGMLAAAGPPSAAATATALPFADKAFDASLALHMLYHVEQPDTALNELARVTDGLVLISTNAIGHLRELHELHAVAASDVGATIRPPDEFTARFHVDEAEQAAGRHFAQVERTDLISTACVTEVAPVVAFIASTTSWHGDDDAYSPILERVGELVAEAIARDGAFRFRTHMGFLACR